MLRISLAKLLHKLPDEIDSIDYEDCLRLAIHCQIENEQVEAARNPSGAGPGRPEVKTDRHVMTKKKPKNQKR